MNEPAHSEASTRVPVLDATQARALGCLIEKEATTPDVYPLSVNAVVTAANQKTARDPVMNLSTGDIHHALRQLEQQGLAKQSWSARSERYEHRLTAALDLTQQQAALLGLLLLRGPQTPAELLARSERLARLHDAEDLRHHLERLIQRHPALVVQIPRGPGQREDRYMHLLGGPVDVAAVAARVAARGADAEAAAPASAALEALESRVQALEQEMAELKRRLDGGG